METERRGREGTPYRRPDMSPSPSLLSHFRRYPKVGDEGGRENGGQKMTEMGNSGGVYVVGS